MTGKTSACLEWALRYAALDWRIVVAGYGPDLKSPPRGFRWRRWQNGRAPTQAELGDWFCKAGKSVPAVILGAPSGGLACRDFDCADDYNAWSLDHPELAGSLPTAQTGREGGGFHVYLRCADWAGFLDLGESGEWRGDAGHYCVLPPAKHKTGTRYTWIVEPTRENLRSFNRAELVGTGLLPASLPGVTEDTEWHSVTSVPSVTSVSSVSSVTWADLPAADRGAVQAAIQETAATSAGQRNRRVFAFARRLKAVPSVCGLPAAGIREFVRQWWESSLPSIRTKSFADTYGDFVHAWQSVKTPANVDFLPVMLQQARARPCKTGFGEQTDILAALCRELQAAVGDDPFYLSIRGAAESFGEQPVWGSRRLRVLEAEGWIVCVERGSADTQRASRFRFVGAAAGVEVDMNL